MSWTRSSRFVSAAICSVTTLAATGTGAQDGLPIYVQYEGFTRESDGTYVLSFGYISHNDEAVAVAPGRENFFVPSPVDRNQPTTFLPGRHRFACTMIAGSDRDRELQWSLTWASRTSRTTERALDPRYALDPASVKRALRGVNVAGAPRGVCLNHPPAVHVQSRAGQAKAASGAAADASQKVVAELELHGEVIDDGLPRGGRISTAWKQMSGPGSVTFLNPAHFSTRARFSAFGAYEIALIASDSQLIDSAIVKVALTPAGAPPTP
jgi:hypothetical protein